ncbi:6-carboxytetrahydropterin synthase QueD [Micromonospora arborensis]|uniref:6-carboxytetrahydropterin synthase QueD n=1 Tax=Micromonospora arborensis TaxID=2116518 RepID=UPI0033FE667E
MTRPAPAGSNPVSATDQGIYRIGKTFKFEAAHQLGGLPAGHQCGRVHGHSYTVEITLVARQLTGPGFVVDFAELEPLQRHLDDEFDHQSLNNVIDVEPTSENLARVLFDWCSANLRLPDGAAVEAVRVRETATSWAEYRREIP